MNRCDMYADCTAEVTHIGEKGYVYCAEHVGCRQGYERCRKMHVWERNLILSGKPLPSYKPLPKGRS